MPFRCLFILALTVVLCSRQALAVEVLTTIKPLQLIAREITQGVAEPRRLLEPGASPHDYQLRPSDMQRLSDADLVLWVGPSLELFLQKPLANLPSRVTVVQLGADDHPQDATASGGPDEAHHHEGEDPHTWLSPKAAGAMATTISRALQAIDPENASRYRENEAAFQHRLAALDETISAQLGPIAERGYFVFHDGYGHFEARYGLNHLGAFTLSPGRRPGARQLASIRHQLEQSDAVCVFSEPQFQPRLIETMTDGLSVRRGILDPMAGQAQSFEAFLRGLADEFERCLAVKADE